MKDEQKSSAVSNRWMGTAPLLLLPVWVAVVTCFFYYLVHAGLPGQ